MIFLVSGSVVHWHQIVVSETWNLIHANFTSLQLGDTTEVGPHSQ